MMRPNLERSRRAWARELVAGLGAEVFPNPRPRILMYHRVFESNHRLAVTPDLFRQHLDFLADTGKEVLSVKDLLSRLDEPNLDAVALSFDDGYSEIATVVREELAARSMGATFFVLPRFTSGKMTISPEARFDDGGNRFLNLEEIRSLNHDGFEIGAHCLTHRSLTDLNQDESRREIIDSRVELSQLLGQNIPGIAFPRGHYDTIHKTQAEMAGFDYAVSVRPGALKSDLPRWDLPRTEIAGGDTIKTLSDKLLGGLDMWHGTLQAIRTMTKSLQG